MSFFEELKRRNVFRVGIAYAIVSWIVLQVVDVVLPFIGLPDSAGRLVLFLILAGLPIALVLGWAFEMTPEGLKREKDVDRTQYDAKRAGRKMDFFIIGVLAVAVIYLVLDDYVWDKTTTPDPAVAQSAASDKAHSIAVLPFANRSAAAEDAYFVDGIHDDILTQLAKLSAFDKVISRTSVEQYRGTTKAIPEIASELGVTTILEGGVQRAADRVRINVQLIDANNDEHLWADTFDRELTASNIFAIQSEIAAAIASALQTTLSPVEQQRLVARPTESLAAYEAYLLGKQRLAQRTVITLQEAKQSFEKALEFDPAFALAWVGIADSVNLLRRYGGRPLEILSESEEAIDKALQLDPHLGEAYAARGYLRDQKQEVAEARTSFERALELSPNYASAYQWYANLLLAHGSPAEALAIRQRGLELDPLSRIMILETGANLEMLGRSDEALAHYHRVLEIDPDYAPALRAVAIFYLTTGTKTDAIPWLRRAIAADPSNPEPIAMMVGTYLDLRDLERATFWIEQARRLDPESFLFLLGDFMIKVYEHDEENLMDVAQNVLAVNPGCSPCIDMIRRLSIRQGEFDLARQVYIDYFPEFENAEYPVVNLMNVAPAIQFAYVLSEIGEESHAENLRSTALSVISDSQRLGIFGFGISDVMVYAQQGEKDEALRALRTALDEGWRLFWWSDLEDPTLDFIRNEPEFMAIVAEIEADMAAQLEQIREMERNGELAPIPAALQ